MTGTPEIPLLRYRDGALDSYFEKPVTIIGHVSRVDFDCVTIFEGPNLEFELYIEDLSPLFDDDEDLTVGIFADAANHRDTVTIALTAERVTYDNPKQLQRSGAAAGEESPRGS